MIKIPSLSIASAVLSFGVVLATSQLGEAAVTITGSFHDASISSVPWVLQDNLLRRPGVSFATDVSDPAMIDSLVNLNNGTLGTIDTSGAETSGYDHRDYWITVTLATADAPKGYDLTGITTYAGWSNYRVNQLYDVYYQTAGSSTWELLTSVTYEPIDSVTDVYLRAATRVQIADDGSAFLAQNVTALRFDMKTDVTVLGNLGAKYREFEIFGSPSAIPEPGTYTLFMMAAGLGTLARFRYRKA